MFKFKNFGSFKEEACLDLRAIKAYKEHPYNVIDPDAPNSYLKVMPIYGANASGKTTLVKAYYVFQHIILESFTKNEKSRNIEEKTVLDDNYSPFFFDEESQLSDTEFEAVFIKNDIEYRYGYSYNATKIEYEWFYKKPLKTGRTSMILERSPEDGLVLGASIKKSLDKYRADIDNDVLALSFFSSLKLKTNVFSDMLKCVNSVVAWMNLSGSNRIKLLEFFLSNESEDERIQLLSFLKAIDVGIKDIKVEKNNKKIEIYTFHSTTNSGLSKVPVTIESDGTINAMVIYSLLRLAVDTHNSVLIDEMNMQLHPLLMKYLIDLFNKDSRHSQLIYTTHDTTLLDKRYMRRDQIWFVEKNEKGESSLYSLAEFRVRNDESFEKEYLGGVFGAIPVLKDFSFLEDADGKE